MAAESIQNNKMSSLTSPSASLQSGADAARIKRLERELADTKRMFERELGPKLDEIERHEAVIQEFIAMKDRASEDHDVAQRNPDRPKGSINEKDGEEVKQLRAELAQKQNTLSRYTEANEKFAKMTQALEERIQEGDQRYRTLEERHRKLQCEYSGLVTNIFQHIDVVESSYKARAGLVNSARGIHARISASSASKTFPMSRLSSNVSLDVGAVEKQEKANELAEMKEAEWKVSIEHEDSQLLCSEPASGEAQALPKRVSRSSAETELLRLKDRKTLNRLGPF